MFRTSSNILNVNAQDFVFKGYFCFLIKLFRKFDSQNNLLHSSAQIL
ncbi:hypothetical protein THF1C08_10052 [Vibrio jasicida]|uniref:Uncharacterized protein n=1 Tax=Vibrio jasicida TaxID=766224 RepID=A0AAU9QDB3_9VIBR|nr:hypothetical protein THF1C08_10052 [Vibrio jasicida]CAH1562293.1 hypothetical protein THF1A12_10052 [Vibrio jasicida]